VLIEQMNDLLEHFDAWIETWDRESEVPDSESNFSKRVLAMHQSNFRLWRLEDIMRRNDLPDALLVATKRNIDKLNQQRNDAIEKIDEELLETHYGYLQELDLPMRTETPGGALDRLSVLALKVFHMRQQAERKDASDSHKAACTNKLTILLRQQQDLRAAYSLMIDELNRGIVRYRIYRQFKMYNDPSLNPQLYNNQQWKIS